MRNDWSERVAKFVKKVHFAHPEAIIRIKSAEGTVIVSPPGDSKLEKASIYPISEIAEKPLACADEAILCLANHLRHEIKAEIPQKKPSYTPVELIGGPFDGQFHYVTPGAFTLAIPHETQIFQYVRKNNDQFEFVPSRRVKPSHE